MDPKFVAQFMIFVSLFSLKKGSPGQSLRGMIRPARNITKPSLTVELLNYVMQVLVFPYPVRYLQHLIFALVPLCALSTLSSGQALNGTIKGVVTLELSGSPVHNVTVTILQLKRSVQTEDDGSYTFSNLPPGRYTVVAHLDRVPDAITTVQVSAGATATADLKLQLEPLKLQITVTASGSDETTFDSIQSVETLGSLELAQKNPLTLGEALENET